VAFSGEVDDPESGEEKFTEDSSILNPNLKKRDIRQAFKDDEFQILLVANKFQTGFDQPLLCGMYVDKRLGGIQAVQTLSRLNRAYSGPFGLKDTTFVLDFVNEPEEILAAFKTYYETATLEDVTDPDLVYRMKAKLDGAGHYDEFEVDRVAAAELNPAARPGDLSGALGPIADRLLRQYKAAQARYRTAKDNQDQPAEPALAEMGALRLFKADMGTFCNAYTFLSQIFDYGNSPLEKRAIQAPGAAAGVRAGTRWSRPVAGDLDPPYSERQGQALPVAGRRRLPAPAASHGGGLGLSPGERESPAGRDHCQGE